MKLLKYKIQHTKNISNSLEKKIPDAAKLIHINQYNTDKQNLEKKIGDADQKIPDTSGLVTTTVLNTKVNEVENKIPNHDKYVTTPEFNKLTAETFTARLMQANLVTETNFDNKLTSYNTRITSSKTKYLEVQKKLTIITNDYNFFLGRMYFRSNDGSQNTFFYQPTLDKLELKKDKDTCYVLSQKSNGLYNSKLKPLYTGFLHSITISGHKMGIKFDKDPLAVDQNNYFTKIVNVYIVNDLNPWPRSSTNNIKFKNCLFRATNLVKSSDK